MLLINTVLYSVMLKKKKEGWYKIITLFLWVMLLIQICAEAASYIFKNNILFYHLYAYLQALLLGVFYYNILKNDIQKRVIKWYLVAMTVFLVAQYVIYPHLLFQFNLIETLITSYLTILSALFYLYGTISEKREFSFLNYGILLSIVFDISVLLFGNILIYKNREDVAIVWILRQFSFIFMHMMFMLQWFYFFVFNKIKI